MAHVVDRYLLPGRPIESIDEYLATDIGGLGLQRAIDVGPEGTIALLTQAGLRGRVGLLVVAVLRRQLDVGGDGREEQNAGKAGCLCKACHVVLPLFGDA